MKTAISVLLVLALYGCIALAYHLYGFQGSALMALALILMGILEGIV
jgi:hypothetical protein